MIPILVFLCLLASTSVLGAKDPLAPLRDGSATPKQCAEIFAAFSVEVGDKAIMGRSDGVIRALEVIDQVAHVPVTVLISGESGTGKELFARLIHDKSPRKDEPYISINCATIPENLIESHLFGHVRGAFTDAIADREGVFRQADGGTLYLDEIGELPLGMQATLLRVIEDGKVTPVGGSTEYDTDVRIVAATNRNLSRAVQKGEFRQDLYYRLNVIELRLPPLRERNDDYLILAYHFLNIHAGETRSQAKAFSPGAIQKLGSELWPGNIRQLENTVKRAMILARGEVIEEHHITDDPIAPRLNEIKDTRIIFSGDEIEILLRRGDPPPSMARIVQPLEVEVMTRALRITDGDVPAAASLIGITSAEFKKKKKAYDIKSW